MNRTEKATLVAGLHKEFAQSPHTILVDFTGLSVPAVTEFRRKMRQSGSTYRVIKNSLALRAAKDTPIEKLSSQLVGTTGIAWNGKDPVVLAKVLVDFAKDHPTLVVKGGIVSGGQMLDANGVKALSSMPSLAELRATLLGMLQAPASKLVRLLSTPASQMVRVLQAHVDADADAGAGKGA